MSAEERNFQFLQIAMKYLPEAQQFMNEKNVQLDMEDLQPLLKILMDVMSDAYELGKND